MPYGTTSPIACLACKAKFLPVLLPACSLFKMVSSSAFFDPVSGASVQANNEAIGTLTGIPVVSGVDGGGGYANGILNCNIFIGMPMASLTVTS